MSSSSAEPTGRRGPSPMMLLSVGAGTVIAVTLISFVSHFTTSAPATTTLPEPAVVGTKVTTHSLPALTGHGDVTAIPVRGQRTVLVFFASWCGPCRRELPEVEKYAATAPSDVAIVGVAANDSPNAAAEFLDSLGVTIAAVSDEDGSVTSSIYGFGTLPETVFVNSDGTVRHVVFGGVTENILRQGVGALR